LPHFLRRLSSPFPVRARQLALVCFFYRVLDDERLLVIAPKNAFGAWDEQIAECVPSIEQKFMRLLQLSANPTIALQAMVTDDSSVSSGIVDKVIEEGPSTKMRAVAEHARQLAREGQKSVIWTIFTGSILDLEVMIADLNPVSPYGAVPSGDASDPNTREGRLLRFHLDDDCKVLIANLAAAGEGISLHTVCHNAIYLDRSYVSTHYLQSIDRIHRLGLPPETETHIHIYQSKAPRELGSIDLSVSRRLATKIRNMQQLLEDPDLHRLALDEEDADDPIASMLISKTVLILLRSWRDVPQRRIKRSDCAPVQSLVFNASVRRTSHIA